MKRRGDTERQTAVTDLGLLDLCPPYLPVQHQGLELHCHNTVCPNVDVGEAPPSLPSLNSSQALLPPGLQTCGTVSIETFFPQRLYEEARGVSTWGLFCINACLCVREAYDTSRKRYLMACTRVTRLV